MAVYHGNLLNTEFENEEFLKKYKILEKRASTRDNWIHYLVEIPKDKLEESIQDIQTNLLPKPWYAHLYNEDGSDVVVIFKTKVFRLPADDQLGWQEVDKFMEE